MQKWEMGKASMCPWYVQKVIWPLCRLEKVLQDTFPDSQKMKNHICHKSAAAPSGEHCRGQRNQGSTSTHTMKGAIKAEWAWQEWENPQYNELLCWNSFSIKLVFVLEGFLHRCFNMAASLLVHTLALQRSTARQSCDGLVSDWWVFKPLIDV